MEIDVDSAPDFLGTDQPHYDEPHLGKKIADAKSDTYKPVSDDENRWLTAMATYTDRRGPGNTMHMSSANTVVESTDNVAPEFKEGGDKPVMQATRMIAENSVSVSPMTMIPIRCHEPCATLATRSWPPIPTGIQTLPKAD